jgi:hypothetical protein
MDSLLSEGGGVFIAMPIYLLGKASAPTEQTPSLDEMRRTVGRWLAGESTDSPAPRGVVTAAVVIKTLSQRGMRGVLDIVPCCTLLSLARSVQASRFLASPCEWLLFIDDDISAGAETVLEMLSANADCLFATYAQRMPPHRITLRTLGGRDPRRAPLRRTASGARILEVAGGGLGLALVRRRVIETLVERHPELAFQEGGKAHVKIFEEQFLDTGGERRSVGEDLAFYARVLAAGFKVECLADATVNHDGTIANLGEFLDSDVPLASEAEAANGDA